MIFALLTLLAALGLAGVAGWFSIIGIMSIYAGAAIHALIMGTVLEGGKLVTISWLYRNWDFANWKLKAPLVIFTLTLMLANGIGVFGFLSKAHLEQGVGTIDNGAKIERLDQQIAREKSTIDDDQKVITQLDNTINSYLGKDRADRSVFIRKSQAPQRKQLRDDIDASQKRIDDYSDQKLKLQSEVKKMQLDVGPIRYIAELIYGTNGDADKNIESAVRIFTLIIVSTLDPLAVILLIAANHTLLRRQREKEQEIKKKNSSRSNDDVADDTNTTKQENFPKIETIGAVSQEDISGNGTASLSNRLQQSKEETLPVEVLSKVGEDLNEEIQDSEEFNKPDADQHDLFQNPVPEESDTRIIIDKKIGSDEDNTDNKHTFPTSPISPISSGKTINEEEETPYDIDLARAEEEGLVRVSLAPVHKSEKDALGQATKDISENWKISGVSGEVPLNEETKDIFSNLAIPGNQSAPIGINSPNLSKIGIYSSNSETEIFQSTPEEIKEQKHNVSILADFMDRRPHFIPQRINEDKFKELETSTMGKEAPEERSSNQTDTLTQVSDEETQTIQQETSTPSPENSPIQIEVAGIIGNDVTNENTVYPKTLSWLNEFKRS
jgi:hypothetical protein